MRKNANGALFLHGVSALFRHFLKTLLEGRRLLWWALFVLMYFAVYGIFINKCFEQVLLSQSENIAEKIVVTQSCRVIIENAKEHYRHYIHHPFHRWISSSRHLHV